jgi:hypothetical protein
MSRHRLLITILGLAAAFAVIPVHVWARGHENPAKLRDQIQRERNPVKKAKLEIRLARLDLQEGLDAYNHNQVRQGEQILGAYFQEMTGSWDLLKNSGRNAVKNPSGFMQLEIALRENARFLNDLAARVTLVEQAPIRKTLSAMSQLHSRVLLALFPGAAPPPVTARKPPKIGANAFASKEPHP